MPAALFLAVYAVLLALDAWSTVYILRHGGREENPLLRWSFAHFGVQSTLAVAKVGAFVYALIEVDRLSGSRRLEMLAFYAFVAAWNFYQVWRLRRATGKGA